MEKIPFFTSDFTLSADTRLCASFSENPSSFGTRFHNYLFQSYRLNILYKAFKISDIQAALSGMRALNFKGAAISMPFKESCLKSLDEMDEAAQKIGAVNTVINEDGKLKGFNTDTFAVRILLEKIIPDYTKKAPLIVCVHGSGGMAKAVLQALSDCGIKNGLLISRNSIEGEKCAKQFGYEYFSHFDELELNVLKKESKDYPLRSDASLSEENQKETLHNPDQRSPLLLINCTPIGMAGGKDSKRETELSFPKEWVEFADIIFDVVAKPVETPLIQLAKSFSKKIITGGEVVLLQAIEQFKLYTGIDPDETIVKRANEFALFK